MVAEQSLLPLLYRRRQPRVARGTQVGDLVEAL